MIKKSILNPGEVALVGSGPGDVELLTLRAVHFIEQADVVVYDRLVSEEIMALLPSDCEKIYVGKAQSQHSVPQERINEILAEEALLNKRVLRLKGGDPFVFGRGGEEAEHLLQRGVNCHLCPGITAASGCTTFAGIPLTHRGVALGCTFITGHLQNNGQLNLPWQSLQEKTQTVVFYMGLNTLPIITEKLVEHGRSEATPAALIRCGTQPQQQVFRGTLGNLSELVERHNITPPTLIVVGDVVNQLTSESLSTPGLLQAPSNLNDTVAIQKAV